MAVRKIATGRGRWALGILRRVGEKMRKLFRTWSWGTWKMRDSWGVVSCSSEARKVRISAIEKRSSFAEVWLCRTEVQLALVFCLFNLCTSDDQPLASFCWALGTSIFVRDRLIHRERTFLRRQIPFQHHIYPDILVGACHLQRCPWSIVRRVRDRISLNQRLNHARMPLSHRQPQRCLTILVSGVNLRVVIKENIGGCSLPIFCCP